MFTRCFLMIAIQALLCLTIAESGDRCFAGTPDKGAGTITDCFPRPDGRGCEPAACFIPTDICTPTCTEVRPFSLSSFVNDCDCRGPSEWGLNLDHGLPSTVCSVPDNGTGSITLPPAGCDYLSQDDVYLIIDGLPPGSTIELDGPLGQFDCDGATGLCSLGLPPGVCEAAGGTLAGDGHCFSAVLDFSLTGTGALAGFNRSISIPIEAEIHTGPRTPGDAVQNFAAEVHRLQGEITGDPDFDILRISAGTGHGLPSPGQTTLTRLPDGTFLVDSFFDISYRIGFAGAPGSPLDGLAGTTTATIRIDTGNTPSCGGDCPPLMVCETSIVEVQPGVYYFCCEITENTAGHDFGDAPLGYPTLLPSGAVHALLPGFYLGSGVDAEPNGQPSSLADGDDVDLFFPPPIFDDEDGVRFSSPLVPGFPAYVQVTALSGGLLNAWVDFLADGSWLESGDDIVVDSALVSGLNLLRFEVPPMSSTGYASYARFRLSQAPGTGPGGGAGHGEVEDYQVFIEPITTGGTDFGDAPEPTYPTVLANNGAHHLVSPMLFLGFAIDAEPDGQWNPAALGDDLDLDPGNPPLNVDDEDGIVFSSTLVPGETARAEVFVTAPTGPGFLWAWLDFLGDGWDAGDVVAAGVPVIQGTNSIQFLVPHTAIVGPTYARFRLGSEPLIQIGGAAGSGEVEDYLVVIHPPETEAMDFGDAPAPYPTLGSSNGASHQIFRTFYLGAGVDGEPDGQPDPAASGDDTDIEVGNPPPNYDDEDGIVFHTRIEEGKAALLTVRAGPTTGRLDAWIDYDIDGTWEPGEHLFGGTSIWVQEGESDVVFQVPPTITVGRSFARFRLSTAGNLDPDGPAADGEVEDHEVILTMDHLVFFDGFETGDTSAWSATAP